MDGHIIPISKSFRFIGFIIQEEWDISKNFRYIGLQNEGVLMMMIWITD